VGSMILSFYFISAGIPSAFTRWLITIEAPPLFVVILILVALIPLGCALDTLAIVLIVVPLAYPVITGLGFNGVWFAILFVKLIELGQISPPVGINAFIVSGVSGVKLGKVFRGILPFIGIDLLIVAVLIIFPQIVTWLPNLLVP
ncbi:MAG: TRAP transporter large permease subunit, partial [Propionibacteriaceae bacterium]|nr:TRAP transporter large permease subunit [Propionibacteriaceae bacterium]